MTTSLLKTEQAFQSMGSIRQAAQPRSKPAAASEAHKHPDLVNGRERGFMVVVENPHKPVESARATNISRPPLGVKRPADLDLADSVEPPRKRVNDRTPNLPNPSGKRPSESLVERSYKRANTEHSRRKAAPEEEVRGPLPVNDEKANQNTGTLRTQRGGEVVIAPDESRSPLSRDRTKPYRSIKADLSGLSVRRILETIFRKSANSDIVRWWCLVEWEVAHSREAKHW
jgi:hypothetical protein